MRCGLHYNGKKNELENLREFVGFRCDFPEVNCERCNEVLEVDGIEPDCGDCDLPVLSPGNRDVWELYETINTQFVYDFHKVR